MQLISFKDAKTSFEKIIISSQNEPVIITKNKKILGAFISFEDLKNFYVIDDLDNLDQNNHKKYLTKELKKSMDEFYLNGSTEEEATADFYDSVMNQVKSNFLEKNI